MTAPKRRWFSYSLRTLFALVTVFGVWLGWNLHQVRERGRVLAEFPTQHSSFADYSNDTHQLPLTWRLLGAEPISAFGFDSRGMSDADCRYIERLFPEAKVEHRAGFRGVIFD
jgi:hypothetical protein